MDYLRPKDLMTRFGWGKNKAYELIKKIKEKFGLTYPEVLISEEYYRKYFNS